MSDSSLILVDAICLRVPRQKLSDLSTEAQSARLQRGREPRPHSTPLGEQILLPVDDQIVVLNSKTEALIDVKEIDGEKYPRYEGYGATTIG